MDECEVFRVKCTYCGHGYTVPASALGSRAKCGKCGSHFIATADIDEMPSKPSKPAQPPPAASPRVGQSERSHTPAQDTGRPAVAAVADGQRISDWTFFRAGLFGMLGAWVACTIVIPIAIIASMILSCAGVSLFGGLMMPFAPDRDSRKSPTTLRQVEQPNPP